MELPQKGHHKSRHGKVEVVLSDKIQSGQISTLQPLGTLLKVKLLVGYM